MSAPASVTLTLTLAPAGLGLPLDPALELAGRGYRRVGAGSLRSLPPDPTAWTNATPIHWPQAPVAWGPAPWLALLAADGHVMANATTLPEYFVRAGDQPRIAPGDLTLFGVGPGTDRPYGVARYGESQYGTWPGDGDVFAAVAMADYAWLRANNECGAWSPAPAIVAGGCP